MKALIILLVLGVLSFTTAPNKIEWSNNLKLTKAHFTPAVMLVDHVALICTDIELTISWDNVAIAHCYMDRKRSFIQMGLDTVVLKEVLIHEKKHFDLTEYITRQMNKDLYGHRNVDSINMIYNHWIRKNKTLQSEYDDKTNHHINKAEQFKWNKHIDSLLTF